MHSRKKGIPKECKTKLECRKVRCGAIRTKNQPKSTKYASRTSSRYYFLSLLRSYRLEVLDNRNFTLGIFLISNTIEMELQFIELQNLLANNCTVNFLSIISYFYFISNSVTGHHSKQWLSAFLIFSFPAALAHQNIYCVEIAQCL